MFEYKEKYILDFTNVKKYNEIHEIIERELDFPHNYGRNWDAFWDLATELIDERGLNIEIIGLDKIYGTYKKKLMHLLKF